MILIQNIKEASAIINDLMRRITLYSSDDTLLWNNTFIKRQIDKRHRGEPFTINDHIRAMVYSMTSSNRCWRKLSDCMDINTGSIPLLDSIFHEYDPYILINADPDGIIESILKNKMGNISTNAQVNALIKDNIPKLMEILVLHKSVDEFYSTFIDGTNYRELLKILSNKTSKYKLSQIGIPLAAEYLRNVGHDIAKPDRHICRLLGKNGLNCVDSETANPFEALDIMVSIASELQICVAEADYILWTIGATKGMSYDAIA